MTSPYSLADHIRATIRPGVRALVGNNGAELTFRHIVGRGRRNIRLMIAWAEAAYTLLGVQLVLAPMDEDLIDDVQTGGHLLAWAGAHRVPLAKHCGFRFLFPEDAFPPDHKLCPNDGLLIPGNPYRFPYREISEAIRRSGAEVWTGAGCADGLMAGVLDKAEEFGMAAVFTTQDAWDCWTRSKADDSAGFKDHE